MVTVVGVRCAFVMSISACVLAVTADPIRAQVGHVSLVGTMEITYSRGRAGADGPIFGSDSPRSTSGGVDISGGPGRGSRDRGAGGGPVRIPGDMQAYAPIAHPSVVAHRDAIVEREAQQKTATETRINVARQAVADVAGPLAAALAGSRTLASRPGTIVPSYRRGRSRGSVEAPDGAGGAPDVRLLPSARNRRLASTELSECCMDAFGEIRSEWVLEHEAQQIESVVREKVEAAAEAVEPAVDAAGRVGRSTLEGAVQGAIKGATTGAVLGGPAGIVPGAKTGAVKGAIDGFNDGMADEVLRAEPPTFPEEQD